MGRNVLVFFLLVIIVFCIGTDPNRAADFPQPEMVLIKSGTYTIGGKESNSTVNLSSFYIGKYEVTNAQYKAFCDATGTKYPEVPEIKNYITKYPDHPVIYVSYYDVVAYCNWLSKRNNLPIVFTIRGSRVTMNPQKKGYRLPTEAEWSASAAGGLIQKDFPWGDEDARDRANFNKYKGRIRRVSITWGIGPWKVGSCEKGKNGFGLYDMAGNVWEWVYDYAESPMPRGRNPMGKDTGTLRRIMGGGWWEYGQQYLRLNERGLPLGQGNSGKHLGFRVARKK